MVGCDAHGSMRCIWSDAVLLSAKQISRITNRCDAVTAGSVLAHVLAEHSRTAGVAQARRNSQPMRETTFARNSHAGFGTVDSICMVLISDVMIVKVLTVDSLYMVFSNDVTRASESPMIRHWTTLWHPKSIPFRLTGQHATTKSAI